MKKYGRGRLREAVLEALATPRKTKELAALLEISSSNASACLSVLKKQGEISLIDGRYVAASVAKAAARRVQIAAGDDVPSVGNVAAHALLQASARAKIPERARAQVAASLHALLDAIESDRQAVLATLRLLGES